MNVSYVLWTRRDKKYAGKVTLSPDSDEEAAALKIFKLHAGIPQSGRKLGIVFKWADDAKIEREGQKGAVA